MLMAPAPAEIVSKRGFVLGPGMAHGFMPSAAVAADVYY
jgi:hypothetical protein